MENKNVYIPPPPVMTDAQLKDRLMQKAPEVMDIYLKLATGKMSNTEVDSTSLNAVWKLISRLIENIDAREDITIQSTQDVIALLGRGKIDTSMAIKLMTLLQKKQEIEELPKLLEQLRDAGLLKG